MEETVKETPEMTIRRLEDHTRKLIEENKALKERINEHKKFLNNIDLIIGLALKFASEDNY